MCLTSFLYYVILLADSLFMDCFNPCNNLLSAKQDIEIDTLK